MFVKAVSSQIFLSVNNSAHICKCQMQIQAEEDEGTGVRPLRSRIRLVAIVAAEWSLFQLWKAKGVHPDIVMGQGVGEVVAACVAGVVSLEDALYIASKQAEVLCTLPLDARLVTIPAHREAIHEAIQKCTAKQVMQYLPTIDSLIDW